MKDRGRPCLGLASLGSTLHLGDQPDTAEETVLRAIDLSDESDQIVTYPCYHFLGDIYYSRTTQGY